MKNRYQGVLEQYNQDILNLCPGNFTSRLILALELKKIEETHKRVLEIGCGTGDSARPILENTNLYLNLLDVSESMLAVCRNELSLYDNRIYYICEDGLSYLMRCCLYDVIFSEWVIHNFNWDGKLKLFRQIYDKLNPGGVFLLMDKVLPDIGAQELFDCQMKRYDYLEPEIRDGIKEHEVQDYSPDFRMDETRTINELKMIGFKSIIIIDRLERDVVLMAKK